MYYPFLFILGLAFGSFLNVVSLRYKPSQKLFDLKIIGGRSRCLICKKQLVWHELLPLFSFLFRKGKCRHCGHRISLQYPLVEFLGAMIFVLVPYHFNLQPITYNLPQLLAVGCWLSVFLLFLLLAIIDFREYIIPDEINILLLIFGAALIFINQYLMPVSNFPFLPSFLGSYAMLFGSFGGIWANHAVATLLALLFFGAIIFLSRGKGMGWGDFKLAAALGLIFGWPDILLVLAMSFIFGALISLLLMVLKRKNIKDVVPFGPFLVIGAAAVFFFGFKIVSLYFNFFGLYF